MISTALRRTVRTLYAFACGYCGVSETEVGATLTIDHFLPQNAGGSDDVDNLVYACHACNLFKSTAWNPQEPPVLHPLRTDMTQHVQLGTDGVLQALSPQGIRHMETLHLNRPPLVERRKTRRLLETLLALEEERLERDQQLSTEAKAKAQSLRRRKKRR